MLLEHPAAPPNGASAPKKVLLNGFKSSKLIFKHRTPAKVEFLTHILLPVYKNISCSSEGMTLLKYVEGLAPS